MSDIDTQNVQTEGTNAAVVEETVLGSSSLPSTGWWNAPPNSYGSFGSSFKKTRRDPISPSLQLEKSMMTDEDSGISVEWDVTKDIIDRFAEGVFRSVWKHSGGKGQSMYQVRGVTATGFTVDANGDLAERTLVFVLGAGEESNNGLWMVGAGSIGTEIKVAGLTIETDPPANMQLQVAGFRFVADDAELDVDGNLITTTKDLTTMGLNRYQGVYIGGELGSANAFATEDFHGLARVRTVAAHKLSFDRRTWLVEQNASLDLATLAIQLDTVIEAQAAGSAGNAVTVASVADGTPAAKAELQMNAAGNAAHINTVVRAKTGGTAGNLITVEVTTGAPTAAGVLTEIGTHVKLAIKATAVSTTVAQLEALIGTSTLIEVKTAGTAGTSLDATDAFDSVPLAGGTAASAASVAEVGDAVTLHYTPGSTTVSQLEAAITSTSTKIQVKRAGTSGNVLATGDDDFAATALAGGASGVDDGAGKQIDLYFTKFIRNVSRNHPDFRRKSYGFEITYPELFEGEDGYEYLLGNMIDEWAWNIPLTGKSTINASFIGTRTLNPTSTRKAGPADALDPVSNEGVSTSTDLQRLRVVGADELGITTDFQSMKVTHKNNVNAEKALAHLGATRMNHGQHETSLDFDSIFTSARVIAAVKSNETCMLDTLMRNNEFGAWLDVHGFTLDSADRKMEKNKSVKIGSKGTAFKNGLSGSTDSLSMFAYLPTVPQNDEE